MKLFLNIISIIFLAFFLTSCTTTQNAKQKKSTSVHGGDSILNPSDVIVKGRKDMEEKIKIGPKPYDTEFDPTLNKRKTITTEQVRNYVTVPSEYIQLKQIVNLNFN